MARASDNGGVYPYPAIEPITYANTPAPEGAQPERTGLVDDSGPRVKGLQPGFDYPGLPLSATPGAE
jgi:hypothetical protein